MASTLIGGLAVAAPAMAQDADDDVVVITGSRIQRTDTVAPSPITSVDEELFELNNVVNTEDLLNTLPQLIPAFDATSNNPGNGTATVSLRGLGTTRTLVLVDGQRFVGLVGIFVRVPAHGQFAVGLLDLRIGGRAADAQDLVEVLARVLRVVRHGCFVLMGGCPKMYRRRLRLLPRVSTTGLAPRGPWRMRMCHRAALGGRGQALRGQR